MREIKDALDLITGEKIYFTGHAEATYTRDGRTVEQALEETKGLKFSEERTLFFGEEGKELTEEERAYNKETFELLDSGTPVTINIEGQILEIFVRAFNIIYYYVKQDYAFISLNEDGEVNIITNAILLSQDSSILKSSIDDLWLLLVCAVVFPYIIDENTFKKYRSDEVYFDDNDNLIIGFNKDQSRVNIIYDFVNDTLDIKEINMSGGSQSDFNLSFSKDF